MIILGHSPKVIFNIAKTLHKNFMENYEKYIFNIQKKSNEKYF